MTPERYEQVAELFAQALELDPAARSEWLDRNCDGPGLRQEVETMLAADQETRMALDRPLVGALAPGAWSEGDQQGLVGKQLGSFKLRRVLASGGMGTVYEAVRQQPELTVAVKVMRRGLTSPSMLRRFELEAALLARLQHPGIAQVLDAGIQEMPESGEKLPWFAMELVPGARPLTSYADEQRLGTRARLELFLQVCEAVQHGHHKGVIHRDLKPANLLVDAEGRPKVIDFGVARSTDADLALTTQLTDIGQIIGTLQYMSPEQCVADPERLDARTDVYALSVVLYELLCGRLPYDVSQLPLHVAVRTIQDASPARPSTIDRRLSGDLETIVLKGLEKERRRRYASVHDFAEDVRGYLESRPIAARPPTVWYQLSKLMQRHRPVAAGILLGLLLLLVGTAVATWQALVARESARTATKAEQDAQEQLAALAEVNQFLHDVLVGADPNKVDGRPLTIAEALRRAVAEVENSGPWPPRVEAQLRYTVGHTLLGRGQTAEALPHLERAVALWREILVPGDGGIVLATNDVAIAFGELGRGEEAEKLIRENYELCLRVCGPDDEVTALTAGILVLTLWREDWWDEAARRGEELLEWYRAERGETDRETINTLNNLALIYDSQGRAQESLEMMREVIELGRKAYGPTNPRALRARLSYAVMLNDHGDYAEAERIASELVESVELAMPDDITVLGAVWRALSRALQGQGRFEKAEPWARRALEEGHERLGDDHPWTIGALSGYGVLLQGWGKPLEADPILREALALAEDNCSPGDSQLYNLRATLGWNRMLLGDLTEAEELLREALDEARAALPPGHPAMLRIQGDWARLLEEQGSWGDALRERADTLEGLRDALGPNHTLTLMALQNMARCHSGAGQPELALQLFQELVQADILTIGPDHEATITARADVADVLCDLGRFDLAERSLREALASAERHADAPPGIAAALRVRLQELRLAHPELTSGSD